MSLVRKVILAISISLLILTIQTERVCPPNFSTEYQSLCSIPSVCDCDYYRGCRECCSYIPISNLCNYTSSNYFSIDSSSTVLSCDTGYSLLYVDSLSFFRKCSEYCECDANTNNCEYCCKVTELSCYRRESVVVNTTISFTDIKSIASLATLPTNYTATLRNPIIDQGACGSSHAISAASVFSERLSRFYGTMVSVSPQNFLCQGTSIFNSTINLYPGCSGGIAYDVLSSLSEYPGHLTCTGGCRTGCLPYDGYYGGVIDVSSASQCRVGFTKDESVVTEIRCLTACNCSTQANCDCCKREDNFCLADVFNYSTACDALPPDTPYRTSCTDTCTAGCSNPAFSSQERYRARNVTTCLIYNGNWPAMPNADLESVVMCNLFTEGVMTVTMLVNDTFLTFFQDNPDRIFNSSSPQGLSIGVQTFVLIGWGVGSGSPGIKFWRLATNWGTKFGLDGVILVERGINLLNIESEICMIGAAADLPNPQQQVSGESPGIPFLSSQRDLPETNQWFSLQTDDTDLQAAMSKLYGSNITVANDVTVLISQGQLASGLLIYANFSVGNFSYEGLVLRPAYDSSEYVIINNVPPIDRLLSSSPLILGNALLLAILLVFLPIILF
ncbi:Papain-like cysteine peptidase [Oopsacas minuta]|uniref:Papain-like cysteine peptidase n=1 Tax=Oopsacas minuta TaxID=111878 RepID=A0AAV7KGE4_9METZ|nr:Papain-like cysteine peptidase [Oopsacas minuta]